MENLKEIQASLKTVSKTIYPTQEKEQDAFIKGAFYMLLVMKEGEKLIEKEFNQPT